MYEEDIDLPAVVHGPVLVSFGDLNGFEFGTKVRNPYEALFEKRTPDDVIANGIAVFYGDFSFPEGAALKFEQLSERRLKKDPAGALEAARQGVALVPEGFDTNMSLGTALAANGDADGARAAYAVAMRRVGGMEPTAQEHWRPIVEGKIADLSKAAGK
jgi:hypothetical protein